MSASVLVLYNEPLNTPGAVESDAGVLHEVAAVSDALRALDLPCRCVGVRTLEDAGNELRSAPESCVINLVESLNGSAADACLVPAVCAALGKAWTGSGTACQLLALDKWQSKSALQAAGVPVPSGVLIVPGGNEDTLATLTGRVIVKPLCADASEGIDATSVVLASDVQALHERIARIHAEFGHAALVESYVEGREFNVSILARDGQPTVLPLAEIDFCAFDSDRPRIVDYRAKWIEDSFEFANTPRRIPAEIDEATAERIRAAALGAWRVIGCRQYARIDMRVDAAGHPFVIEVNPNPDISPDAGIAAALHADGIAFEDFVKILIMEAGVSLTHPSSPSMQPHSSACVDIRRTTTADRDPILALLEATQVFQPYELDVAREVLDDALAAAPPAHYHSTTALLDGAVAGWACFGPTPCTDRTFDLYWLAVHPDRTRRGIAAALLLEAETGIRAQAGRLVVVETSSRPDYDSARRFYERHGYQRASVIADFYGQGDDKLIYVKRLIG